MIHGKWAKACETTKSASPDRGVYLRQLGVIVEPKAVVTPWVR